jgi:endo-1,4-beta-xylanase
MVPKALLALAPTIVSAQLHSLAVDAGLLYWGTAVGNQATNDQAFMAIANDLEEHGQLVPENGQKWESTQPSQGQFTYQEGDVVANLATGNGQILRCHTLVWYSQLPGWGQYIPGMIT